MNYDAVHCRVCALGDWHLRVPAASTLETRSDRILSPLRTLNRRSLAGCATVPSRMHPLRCSVELSRDSYMLEGRLLTAAQVMIDKMEQLFREAIGTAPSLIMLALSRSSCVFIHGSRGRHPFAMFA